ncbi:MAG TPA: hypothetical protein VEA38_24845, partial [Terriglobales bacterium]|nr:hypothetical protein [Terriglobales bacterium]
TFVNTTATRAIVQLHDKATAPANTDVPIWMDACPSSAAGNGALTVDFGQYGIYFANGIYVAASSTTTPLTLLAGDTMVACALYA